MRPRADLSAARRTQWSEYGVRFVFGGLITAGTGLIAKVYGPTVGGLFLAFPAIFPASATLIDKHERQKKQRAGVNPGHRGNDAAALEAAGAAMGSIGLLAFAVLVWRFLPATDARVVLVMATFAWFVVSVVMWRVCEKV
jgi:hypothetical protein